MFMEIEDLFKMTCNIDTCVLWDSPWPSFMFAQFNPELLPSMANRYDGKKRKSQGVLFLLEGLSHLVLVQPGHAISLGTGNCASINTAVMLLLQGSTWSC